MIDWSFLSWRQWRYLATLPCDAAAALAHARQCRLCQDSLAALAVPRRSLERAA